MMLTKVTIKNRLRENLNIDCNSSKIIVVGLGVTGISVARFLKNLGYPFLIVDSRQTTASLSEVLQKEFEQIKIFSGAFDVELFCSATHLIVSPGISLKENAIEQAKSKHVKIVGDIDLFVCATDKPIIGITGSNGKSTVTTMVGVMAVECGIKVGVGGNLGVPALDLLLTPSELYVLELSSFQLERTRRLNASVATVLNISEDHMDRHENIAEYAAIKQRVFLGTGVMVINMDDPLVVNMIDERRRAVTFSIYQAADFCLKQHNGSEWLFHSDNPIISLSDLPLEGRHNAANALAALALGYVADFDIHKMAQALRKFKGLPHRMQRVAEIKGVVWINDSKATNVGSCIAALQGYAQKVVLIAGGDAKGAEMSALTDTVKEKAKSVVLIGKDAELIEHALNECVPIYKAENIKQAVSIAAKLAQTGDVVLLSPACASLDQFKNYMERGEKFTEAVLDLVA
jgi:UDP-N-acetylmuramoylalanine--D-glutamate ligase